MLMLIPSKQVSELLDILFSLSLSLRYIDATTKTIVESGLARQTNNDLLYTRLAR